MLIVMFKFIRNGLTEKHFNMYDTIIGQFNVDSFEDCKEACFENILCIRPKVEVKHGGQRICSLLTDQFEIGKFIVLYM